MGAMSKRVLLVSMPMAEPTLPNLGMEILARVLRAAGHPCDVLYGSLLMPKKVGRELLHSTSGQGVFAPAYFGVDATQTAESLAALWNPGPLVPPAQIPQRREEQVVDLLVGMDAAEECLDRCMRAIPRGLYDVAALSLIFDAQKLPSIVLAARLKERDGVAVLFGGSACDGGMGRALMEQFNEVDAVAEGDGEAVIVSAVAALRGESPWDAAPNCFFRSDDGIVETPKRDTRLPLDDVPVPDYDEYVRQKAASEYAADHNILMFESSRGCWWGVKHHCTFCGLRADGLAYRERTADLVVSEVRRLQETYRPDLVYASDGILGRRTLKEVLPTLARWRRDSGEPLNLFYEIKSNLKRQEAALLAAAGTSEVQPGIESFSTHHLQLMRKGATALQQIECLKWLSAYGISVTYALIMGFPGEEPEDYEAAVSLMQRIHHLPPAMQINFLLLDQFSPYAYDPDRFDIDGIRPVPEAPIIYQRDDPEWLLRVGYERNYDHPNHTRPDLLAWRTRLRAELARWRRHYDAGDSLLCHDVDHVFTVYRTQGRVLSFVSYRDVQADLLRLGERICTEEHAAQSTGVPLSAIGAELEQLAAANLIVREGNRYLTIAVPLDVDCERDARMTDADLQPRVLTLQWEAPSCPS
jgi:ribosomal peptide maturation radical SAM protein 1